MFDQHFLSSAVPADVFGPLPAGERVMWRGRCGVAEYAFDEAASLPRWALPEATDVLVTDHRVLYAYTAQNGHEVKAGELRWLWPQHLRVQPGAHSPDRGAAATQIQLVCGGADGSYPALVFAGGDLATAADADRLANVIRQAIVRFRLDHAAELGLSIGQARMLSRLLIGPEFRNHQGGEGQTVSMLGAIPVSRPAPAPALPPPAPPAPTVTLPAEAPVEPWDEQWPVDGRPVAEHTRLISHRPGVAADAVRAMMAAKAEETTQQTEPALASRAAELAARVASLVSRTSEPPVDEARATGPGESAPPTVESWRLRPPVPEEQRVDPPTTNLAARAESIRRTAARMAANSARSRVEARHAERETGVTRGNRNG